MKGFCFVVSLILLAGTLEAQIVRKRVPYSSFETVTIAYTANMKGLHTEAQTEASASARQSMIDGLHREYRDLLLVDVGNFIGPTPTSILSEGRFDFAVMARLGYDLVHLSSDDFAVGADNLRQRIAETEIPVLSGNLTMEGTSALAWVVIPCGNRKVGFIGVTSSNFYQLVLANQRRGVVVAPAAEYIAQAIEAMAGKADIVVALTDLNEDEVTLIRDIPGLDLVITTGGNVTKPGSDWVSVGFPGMKRAAVARVLTSSAAIHVLDLHGYPEGNKWTVDEVIGDVYPILRDTPRDQGTDVWIREQLEGIQSSNNKTLGKLSSRLSNEDGKNRQTPLGLAVADLVRSHTKAHLAIVNAGALQKDLEVGQVTEWDLIAAIPYPDLIVVLRLTGEQILAVIARSKLYLGEDGYLQYSNLLLEPEILGKRIGDLKILPDRNYLVGMPEYLAEGGDGYVELVTAPVVERTGMTLADLCRQAFRQHGTMVPDYLPMDEESHFWFSRLRLSTSVDGFVADPDTFHFYPDQVTLIGQQLIASSFNARWDLIRADGLSDFESFVEAQYGLWWDQDWVPTQTLDNLLLGTQFTVRMSNILFRGDRIADPYVSALLETALIYPDPTGTMFVADAPRPGSLKLGLGLSAPTLLRPLSLKFGMRWEVQPFSQRLDPSTGLDAVATLQSDLIQDMLSVYSSTDVFSSLDSPNQGVTVSSVNEVLFTLEKYISLGPRLQLFYNSLVGHWSYLFDVSLVLNVTLH